jgi:hypothetical protein
MVTAVPVRLSGPLLAGTVTNPVPAKLKAWFTRPVTKLTVPLAEPVSKVGGAPSLKLPSPLYQATMLFGAGVQTGLHLPNDPAR